MLIEDAFINVLQSHEIRQLLAEIPLKRALFYLKYLNNFESFHSCFYFNTYSVIRKIISVLELISI